MRRTVEPSAVRPAFYAIKSGAWRDYINLLHAPYTLWHLSYVVMGAAIAPSLDAARTGGTILAFFLAVGVAAHALDERNGHPLETAIPDRVLLGLATLALGGAVTLGLIAAFQVSMWLFPFMIFGSFLVVSYNMELWEGRFHSDFWFALAWGAFPVLTAYWINALSLTPTAGLLASAAFVVTLAQRTLSSYVRTIRRKARRVTGTVELADGTSFGIDPESLVETPERALRLLCIALPLLAMAMAVPAITRG
ncbi:MAG: hypothetical protein IIC87_07310 [Chloroflexi bacterium]|nr:hypothetical protein [Chloroflexota bacterium]